MRQGYKFWCKVCFLSKQILHFHNVVSLHFCNARLIIISIENIIFTGCEKHCSKALGLLSKQISKNFLHWQRVIFDIFTTVDAKIL